MKYIALEELQKYIIHDGCDEGCGYIDERDIAAIPTVELDKIRAEIDEQYDRVHPYDISCAEGLEMALGIIDKYMAEGSDKE